MSRDISQTFREAIYAQETDEVFLVLITIEHSELEEPIRLCNNSTNITSRGNIYLASPIRIILPSDAEGEPPKATLTIDNIDRVLVAACREISSAPIVTLEIIRASEPDVVEAYYTGLQLHQVRYDRLVVEGQLNQENFLSEPFPSGCFTPDMFPGLF